MIKRFFILTFLFVLIGCNTNNLTEFSDEALQDMMLTRDDTKLTLREVLHQNKGKTILIDVWASWCKDCVVGFPKIEQLQKEFPEVAYIFLSVDRGNMAWKRGVERFNLKGQHYNFPKGQKNGDFVEFINLWWIPRYMVIDKNGKIIVFNATDANDKKIRKALQQNL